MPGRRRLLLAAAGTVVVLAVALGVVYLLLQGRTGDISNPDVPFAGPARPNASVDPFEWPLYGYTPQHTRAYVPPHRMPRVWHAAWTYHARALAEFPPVISRGVAYQLADDGRLAAVDTTTGRLRWRRRLGALSASTPAVSGGTVWATVLARDPGGRAGSVAALSTRDGRVLWSHDLPSRAESSPLLEGGRLFFGSEDGTVYCLDARSGRTVWTYRAAGAVKGSPTYGDGIVYFGDYGGQVHAVRAADGHRVWRTGTSGALLGSGTFYATAALAFGRVYVGNTDGREYSFSARDGKLAWAHQTGNYVYSSAAVQDVPGLGPTVFVGSYDGTLYALDARTGTVRWRHPLGPNSKISGSPTIVGDVVYFADLGHRHTHGLLTRTGRQVFFDGHGSFDPIISDGRRLYLTGYSSLAGLVPGPAAPVPGQPDRSGQPGLPGRPGLDALPGPSHPLSGLLPAPAPRLPKPTALAPVPPPGIP